MAEAEDVITDVARHATGYAQALWRRHRASHLPVRTVAVIDVAQRIDLLIAAVFGTSYRIRTAQAPAPATFLAKAFQFRDGPRVQCALAATDGVSLWLPADASIADPAQALDGLRTAALRQAMRAHRGSAGFLRTQPTPLIRDVYLLLEAHAADEALVRALPGLARSLNALRSAALAARPALANFPWEGRELEAFVRMLLRHECGRPFAAMPLSASPADSARSAPSLAEAIVHGDLATKRLGANPLFKDSWTGELRAPCPATSSATERWSGPNDDGVTERPRSARMTRRPSVRESSDDEDDDRQGAWMIQSAQPQEHAEDPFGLQRPTDRDEQSAAEDFANSLCELAEARLVSTPGRPKEVLLSDDPPDAQTMRRFRTPATGEPRINYPEWDYYIGAYRTPGATVSLVPAQSGSQQWVDETLAKNRSMQEAIRRRFEMLRARCTRLRKQLDGEEVDLEAYVDGHADYLAGLPMAQALYQTYRRSNRDMAIMLLIDVSGSTDGWIEGNRRVIDVEREALLLVCVALEGMGEPYSVQAFSGQGPDQVTIRALKRFDERYDNAIARRIAALEPEEYTRTGAALRHASATLMQQPAAHRLLLLFSDGKPNDVDRYEGRYGIEDTRQAVTEAKLQGIFPFCLTVDRQGTNYLPAMFGARQYALLPQPELLPVVLLDWMRRLVMA